jgi:SPP1 gp7 family putative phage head morphogenesis protein
MPDINDIVDQQRADLARRDVRLLNQISADYQKVVDRIVGELDRLQTKIDKAQAAGEDISPSWLFREQRLKDLLSQAGREFDRFSVSATAETSKEQLVQVRMAETHFFEQESAEFAGADLELGLTFNRLSTRAVEGLVGRASDGSPLKDLFDKLGPALGQSVRDELIQAVALGQGPAVTARRIKGLLDGNEARAQLIARTETLQAYREGAHQTSIENSDVLAGWTWITALDGRACAACVALNGTVHPVDERMAAHPACRCTQRWETKSFAELGVAGVGETKAAPVEAGASWFASVSRETQELILGKAGAKAYAAGDVELKNFVGLRLDPRWGPSYFQRSVKDALEGPQPGVELDYPD